jgi:hypothetical protein
MAPGRRARAEVTIAVNDTMLYVVVDVDLLSMVQTIRPTVSALYNRHVYAAKPSPPY